MPTPQETDYLETRNFHIMFILKFQHALAVCGVVMILGFTSCAIPVSRVFECGRQAETLGHGLKPPAWSWPFRPKMLRNLCGAGSPWGTDRSRDRLVSARKTQVEAVADSFIALGRGGQRLRSSWWGGSASSSPSQASGCAGWRWLCGWQPVGKAGSGHFPWELVPPTLCSQSAGPAPQSGEDHPSQLPRAPAHLVGPALLTMRKSGRYLFFRIMCRMLLRVARAFLLMVVRT